MPPERAPAEDAVSRETGRAGDAGPPPPPAAARVFGSRLALARTYADLLSTAGIERGLLGPREVPRLWERHLLNCAVVESLLPTGTELVDVGAGAGLPGIPLALARPDLSVTLLEPLERRAVFLAEAVERLGLERVTVIRARAEDADRERWAVAVARAVAPLDRLARWTLPLVARGGRLVALKGASARQELAGAETALRRAGADRWDVTEVGATLLDPPTTVVTVWRAAGRGPARGRTKEQG